MPELDFTLKDIARIALGAPDLTQISISLLHTLIDILLKKLNCENEKVSIGGFESKCLEKLLKESQISPFAFNDEKVQTIEKQMEKLNSLEDRIEMIGIKQEKHLQAIRDCNKMEGFKFQWNKWEEYCMPCEDICTACEPENEIACSLLQNPDFLKKMMRIIAEPMVKRVLQIEDKVERLNREFTEFMNRMEERFKKLALLEMCIVEIEGLRKQIEKNHLTFIGTMEEVQEMLDAKLDKVHLAMLKKFIKNNLDDMNKKLKQLEEKQKCPRTAGLIMDGIKCLSCGNTKVCAEKTVYPIGLSPSSTTKPAKCRKKCKCDDAIYTGTNEPTLVDRIQNVDIKLLKSQPSQERRSTRKSCKFIASAQRLISATTLRL